MSQKLERYFLTMSFRSGTLLYTRLWRCRLFLNGAVTAAKTEFNQQNNKEDIFKYFSTSFPFSVTLDLFHTSYHQLLCKLRYIMKKKSAIRKHIMYHC